VCVDSGDINEEKFDGVWKSRDNTVVSVDPPGGLFDMSLRSASFTDKAIFIVRSIEEYIKDLLCLLKCLG
jgi:hypothetical protein